MADIAEYDIVIVGAGASGLAAAAECRAQRLSFRLLEARPRIGGRCLTDHRLGVAVDLGASWIHAADAGNPWSDIALAVGFQVVRDPRRRRLMLSSGLAEPETSLAFGEQLDHVLATLSRTSANTKSSLQSQIPSGVSWRGVFERLMGNWICGVEIDQVDAVDWAQCKTGEDWLVPNGYGELVASQVQNTY